MLRNYLLCSQTWLPTVQEVLQADWQEAGHSPQPPVRRVFFSIALLTVWICFLICITSKSKYYYPYILPCFATFCKRFLLNTIAMIKITYSRSRQEPELPLPSNSPAQDKKSFPFIQEALLVNGADDQD